MGEQELKKLLEEIESGKKKVVGKFQYIVTNLAPIITLVAFLVAGIFWFANAESRMFSNENIKYETETNTVAARQRTFDKLDERYIKKEEFKELKTSIESLNKNILELKLELAKRR